MKFPLILAHDGAGLLPIAIAIAAAGGALALGVSGIIVRLRKSDEAKKIGKWLLIVAGVILGLVVLGWALS